MMINLRYVGASFAAALLLGACNKPTPPDEPIRAVRVVTVGTDVMRSGAEYAGEVRARVEVRLGFRVGGKIIRRQVELGQRVKAGDVLAQLDPRDYKLSADAARAMLASATSNRDLAAADLRRFKELRDQNFISGAELERRDASLKAAQAQLDQARAQLSGQSNQAAYTKLVADVSGVVTSLEAEPGQVVAAGTPVVRIAQDGPRDVVFAVPEDQVALIKQGSPVEVKAWGSATVLKGTVRDVAASTDPVTRTFAIKVAMDAEDTLALGSTVTVAPKAPDGSPVQVIKLPTSAFFQNANQSAVWVLDPKSMKVRLQPVQIATADGNEVVVVAGLQPGMQVVSAGVHVLSADQKVTLYKGKTPVATVIPAQTAITTIAPASAAAAQK